MSVDGPHNPPVTLLSRRRAAGNSKWTIFYDDIRGANGVEVHDYVVMQPPSARPDRITGVSVLPLIGEEVVLLRAYRHPIEEFTWELPRGFVDEGEEPAAAALRELREETGLACAAIDLTPLGLFTPEASTIIGKGALFLARNCVPQGEPLQDEPGLGSLHRFSRAEIGAMLAANRIQDASTLAALFLGLNPWQQR